MRPARQQAGFTLVETLVAMAIMLVAIASFVQVFGIAAAANQRAVYRTLATLAALQKIEELRSAAGTAPGSSSDAVLQTDVSGFNDRVVDDASRTVFLRRWAIEPLPADPLHLLVLQVVVFGPGGLQARIVTVRRTGDG